MELKSVCNNFGIIFCLGIIFTVIFYLYCLYKLSYWTRRGIEQLPNPHIIFGHVKDAILGHTAPGLHMGHLYRSTRPEALYVGFYIFHKPCLLIRDPELARQIFIRDFEVFSDRHFAGTAQLDSLGMVNIFGLNNPVWKFLRNKISPLLTNEKLRGIFLLMLETSESMIEYLKNKSAVKENGGVKKIDIQDLIFKHTIDSISNITLGKQTNSFRNPNTSYTKEGKM